MDFSPYKKNKYNSFSSGNAPAQSKTVKYTYLSLSIAAGIGAVWFIQSLFGANEGMSAYATFEKNTAIAEAQTKEIGIWSAILNNQPITEGDIVHIKEENDAKIRLPDSSFLSLGEGSEIHINKLRKAEETEELFGVITVNKSPILFSGKSNFDKEQELKIFVTDNIYIAADKNTFLFQDNIISFIDGKKIWVGKIDTNGKITSPQEFGIGQSFDITTFTKISTGDILQSSELVAQYKGEELALLTKTEDDREESSDLSAPILLSPEFDGAAIVVKNKKQKIKGTATLDAEKIVIVFSNETKEEELTLIPSLSNDKKTKEWSYTASEQYKTLLPGINSYKIYAVNEENKKSATTILQLSYNAEGSDADETDDDDNGDENETDDDEITTNFLITAPNQGRNTEIEGDTIILNGVASKDVAYITISNMTLDSSYTLQKYKKGQKTWKYWVDELKPDTYKYVVYAKDENKKILSTQKISITLTQSENTKTPKPTPTSTPQSNNTQQPVVTTSANDSSATEATPTPKPTIKSSTAEASR